MCASKVAANYHLTRSVICSRGQSTDNRNRQGSNADEKKKWKESVR